MALPILPRNIPWARWLQPTPMYEVFCVSKFPEPGRTPVAWSKVDFGATHETLKAQETRPSDPASSGLVLGLTGRWRSRNVWSSLWDSDPPWGWPEKARYEASKPPDLHWIYCLARRGALGQRSRGVQLRRSRPLRLVCSEKNC